MQSRAASMTTLDKLDPSLTGRIRISTMICYASGTIWLLTTKAHPLLTPTVDSTAWPAWMRQAVTYPPSEPPAPKPAEPVTDPTAALLAKLNLLQAEMERQRQELEALKKRPSGTTVVNQQQAQAAKVPPPPKP